MITTKILCGQRLRRNVMYSEKLEKMATKKSLTDIEKNASKDNEMTENKFLKWNDGGFKE